MVNAEPQPDPNTLPAPQANDAQTQIEQAADHFDAFSLQLPTVIAAKLDAFRTHGFRAILLDDPETKPAEEAMIDSLANGLKALGNSLEENLSRSSKKTQAQNPDNNPPDNK